MSKPYYLNKSKNKKGITVNIDINTDEIQGALQDGSEIYQDLDIKKEAFYAAFNRLALIFEDLRGSRISESEFQDPKFLSKELARITSEDSVLNGIQKMLNGEFNGSDDNLFLELWGNTSVAATTEGLQKALNDYVSTYDSYFKSFNNTIGYMEHLGSTVRNEKVLHQFGFLNEGSFREVYMDERTMSTFRQDRDVFRLRVQAAKDDVGRYIFNDTGAIINRTSLSTRNNLSYDILNTSLDKLSKTDGIGLFFDKQYDQNSGYANMAMALFNDSSFKGGRGNEALLAGVMRGDMLNLNPNDYKDNLPWYWGGDKNVMINGERYNISQKSINFDAGGNKYGFSLSSENSLLYFERMLYDKENNYAIKDTSTFFDRLFYNYQEADIVNKIDNLPSDISDALFNDVMDILYTDIQENTENLGFNNSNENWVDYEELPEGW